MNDEERKELTYKLVHSLMSCFEKFLSEEMPEVYLKDLFRLILGAHVACIDIALTNASKDEDELSQDVYQFMMGLKNYINKQKFLPLGVKEPLSH